MATRPVQKYTAGFTDVGATKIWLYVATALDLFLAIVAAGHPV
jgi:hypothetical protein